MNEITIVDKGVDWRRLKAQVLDSVSWPMAKRVYNLGRRMLHLVQPARSRGAGFTKATLAAWRVALEARGLGASLY